MYNNFKWTSRSIARNNLVKLYEPLQPYLLVSFSRRFGIEVMFDVGSNIGTYSLFATSIPSIERIYAFEAEEITYKHLRNNVLLNKLNGVTPYLSVVSNSVGG